MEWEPSDIDGMRTFGCILGYPCVLSIFIIKILYVIDSAYVYNWTAISNCKFELIEIELRENWIDWDYCKLDQLVSN